MSGSACDDGVQLVAQNGSGWMRHMEVDAMAAKMASEQCLSGVYLYWGGKKSLKSFAEAEPRRPDSRSKTGPVQFLSLGPTTAFRISVTKTEQSPFGPGAAAHGFLNEGMLSAS